MKEYVNKGKALIYFISILVIVIMTMVIAAGILIYQGDFNNASYAEWLFYASLGWILLAGVSVYSVLSSTNTASYRFGEFMVKGKIDMEDRIKDIMKKEDFQPTIIMLISAVMLMILSSAAYRYL